MSIEKQKQDKLTEAIRDLQERNHEFCVYLAHGIGNLKYRVDRLELRNVTATMMDPMIPTINICGEKYLPGRAGWVPTFDTITKSQIVCIEWDSDTRDAMWIAHAEQIEEIIQDLLQEDVENGEDGE